MGDNASPRPVVPVAREPRRAMLGCGDTGLSGLLLATRTLSLPQVFRSPHPGAGDRGGCAVPRGAVFTRVLCIWGILSARPGSQRGLGSLGLLPLPIPNISVWHRLLRSVRNRQHRFGRS